MEIDVLCEKYPDLAPFFITLEEMQAAIKSGSEAMIKQIFLNKVREEDYKKLIEVEIVVAGCLSEVATDFRKYAREIQKKWEERKL